MPLFSSMKNLLLLEISVNFYHPARREIQWLGSRSFLTVYFCCFNSAAKSFVYRTQETHFISLNFFPLFFVIT